MTDDERQNNDDDQALTCLAQSDVKGPSRFPLQAQENSDEEDPDLTRQAGQPVQQAHGQRDAGGWPQRSVHCRPSQKRRWSFTQGSVYHPAGAVD